MQECDAHSGSLAALTRALRSKALWEMLSSLEDGSFSILASRGSFGSAACVFSPCASHMWLLQGSYYYISSTRHLTEMYCLVRNKM